MIRYRTRLHLMCADPTVAVWWLHMPRCQVGAMPSATYQTDSAANDCHRVHIMQHVCHQAKFHIHETICPDVHERGRGVSNPLVPYLVAGCCFHGGNAPCLWHHLACHCSHAALTSRKTLQLTCRVRVLNMNLTARLFFHPRLFQTQANLGVS